MADLIDAIRDLPLPAHPKTEAVRDRLPRLLAALTDAGILPDGQWNFGPRNPT
ncbi:MAG: hypothetical protein JNM38_25310 [Acidobacteria bacterium]|nr:hypothetical protein [Acidobacteriota bacterium]